MTLLCVTVAAVHSNEQILCLITKLAKTPFHNHNILQSLIVPSVQLSHISPLFISTHTTTIPSLHCQFANKPCPNQGFCTWGTPPIMHIWESPPDGTLLSWSNLYQGPQGCEEGEDRTGCTGKIFIGYITSLRYPTFIHDVVTCYCGCCSLKQATSYFYYSIGKTTIPQSQ
jgi:hypothetical protein